MAEQIDYLIRQAVERLSGVHATLALAQERQRLPKEQRLMQMAERLRSSAEFIDRMVAEVQARKTKS